MRRTFSIFLFCAILCCMSANAAPTKDLLKQNGEIIQKNSKEIFTLANDKLSNAQKIILKAKDFGFKDFSDDGFIYKSDVAQDKSVLITAYKNEDKYLEISTDDKLKVYMLKENFRKNKHDEYMAFDDILNVGFGVSYKKEKIKINDEYDFYKNELDSYRIKSQSDPKTIKSKSEYNFSDGKLTSYYKNPKSAYSKEIRFD